MSQNLISLSLSDDPPAAADQALTALEQAFAGFIVLDGDERRGIIRMGGKSEQFCRQALSVLPQNPKIVPASIGMAKKAPSMPIPDPFRRQKSAVFAPPSGQEPAGHTCSGSSMESV